MCRVLVVAPWGFPGSWRDAYYKDPLSGRVVFSCSSLVYILCFLRSSSGLLSESSCGDYEARVYLLVLESIADYDKVNKKRDSLCSEVFYEVFERRGVKERYIDCLGKRYGKNCYKEISDALKEFINRIYEESIDKSKVSCEISELPIIEPIILPAIGKPGVEITYLRDVGDFKSLALMELSKKLFIEDNYLFNELIIDLSHGINFMPAATYELAYELASLSLLASRSRDTPDEKKSGRKGVRIRVYNSDPTPPREAQEKTPVLRMNIVRDFELREIYLPKDEIGKIIDLRGETSETVIKSIDHVRGIIQEVIPKILRSLIRPYPLLLIYFSKYFIDKQFSDFKNYLDAIEDTWYQSNKWDQNNKTLKKTMYIIPEDLYLILLSYTVAKFIKDSGVTNRLDDIEILAKEIYSDISVIHEELITHEISRIRECAKKLESGGADSSSGRSILLADAYGLCQGQGGAALRIRGQPDKRVMIAHAGFQSEYVLIDFRDKDIYLRYVDPRSGSVKPFDLENIDIKHLNDVFGGVLS